MNYSFASKKVIADNFKKAQLFKTEPKDDFSGWVILAEHEHFELIDDSSDHLSAIENEAIETFLPGFLAIQQAEVDSIYVHNVGFNKLVKIERSPNDQISHDTFATNQGNVTVNFWQWIKYQKQPLLKYYILLFLLILTIPFANIISGIGIGIIFYWMRAYKNSIREFFKAGDTLPGVVTSIRPTQVAVMTDLTKGFGSYPIIKIIQFKFRVLNGKKIAVGDKIPMVAFYLEDEKAELPHWVDVDPTPISFATKDKNKIGEKIYSISMEDWERLEESLHQIKDSSKVGLYKIDIEQSNWANSL